VTTVAVASCLCVRSTTKVLMSVRRSVPIGRRPSIGTMWLRTWLEYIDSVLGRHCWAASQRGLPVGRGDAQAVQGGGPGAGEGGDRKGCAS
jgi:hypothetical protein